MTPEIQRFITNVERSEARYKAAQYKYVTSFLINREAAIAAKNELVQPSLEMEGEGDYERENGS